MTIKTWKFCHIRETKQMTQILNGVHLHHKQIYTPPTQTRTHARIHAHTLDTNGILCTLILFYL